MLALRGKYPIADAVSEHLWHLQAVHGEEEYRKRAEAHEKRMQEYDERMREVDERIKKIKQDRAGITKEGILFPHDKNVVVVMLQMMRICLIQPSQQSLQVTPAEQSGWFASCVPSSSSSRDFAPSTPAAMKPCPVRDGSKSSWAPLAFLTTTMFGNGSTRKCIKLQESVNDDDDDDDEGSDGVHRMQQSQGIEKRIQHRRKQECGEATADGTGE